MSVMTRVSSWFGGLSPASATGDPLPGAGYERVSAPARAPGFDQALVWITVALLAFGLVMVYSASVALPDNPKFARYTHSYFLVRHTIFVALAFMAALVAFQVPMATWERVAPWLFVVSLILLMLVLVPKIGSVVNGARRWISLGFMGFQPSELAKFAVLLYAADYMVRKMDVKERFFR
ncbi:MAG: FtsW/RodA/SpoVE family cell cycle protein, partial [Ramlibacter sp.]